MSVIKPSLMTHVYRCRCGQTQRVVEQVWIVCSCGWMRRYAGRGSTFKETTEYAEMLKRAVMVMEVEEMRRIIGTVFTHLDVGG